MVAADPAHVTDRIDFKNKAKAVLGHQFDWDSEDMYGYSGLS